MSGPFDPTAPQIPFDPNAPPVPSAFGGPAWGALGGFEQNRSRPATAAPASAAAPAPNVWNTPYYAQSLQPQTPVGSPFLDPNGPGSLALLAKQREIAARSSMIDLSNPTNPYRAAVTGANQNVLTAQSATYPLQRNVFAANQATLGAQQVQSAAQRALIGSQMGENQTQIGENAAVRAAQGDTADLAAVAQATGYRQNRDRFNSRLGIDAPQQVETLDGSGAGLPVGTEAALHTNASRLQLAAQRNQETRGLQIASQRLGVQLTGQDVQDAELVAKAKNLSLEQAQQMVTEAKGAAQQAQTNLGLQTAEAGFTEAVAQQQQVAATTPSKPGDVLYSGPSQPGGKWMSQGEKAALEYEDRRNAQQASYDPLYLSRQTTTQIATLLAYGSISETQALAALATRHPTRPNGLTAQEAQAYLEQASGRYNQAQKTAAKQTGGGGPASTADENAIVPAHG